MAIVNPMMNARLTVLLLAPAQWFLIWSLRYVVLLPVRTSLKQAVGALINATAVFGIWIAQGKIYRSMTGIDIPAHDHYFFAIAIGEVLVSLGIGFLIAFELRRKSLREKDG